MTKQQVLYTTISEALSFVQDKTTDQKEIAEFIYSQVNGTINYTLKKSEQWQLNQAD